MTFATATIQGFVNWKSSLEQTPNGRNVVNLLVSVPDKRDKEKSTSYKISVWDKQAASVLEFIQKGQLITAQGSISFETFNPQKPIIRMDFASILDYGKQPDATNFVPVNIDNVKKQATATKQKVASK